MNLVTVSEKIGGRVVAEVVSEMDSLEIKELRTLCEYELSVLRGKIATAKSDSSGRYSEIETSDYIARIEKHIKFLFAVDKIALARQHKAHSIIQKQIDRATRINKKFKLLKKAVQQSVTDEEYLKITTLYYAMVESCAEDLK